MNPSKVIDALRRKFGCETDRALATMLGVTPQTLINWQRTKNWTERSVAGAIYKAHIAATKHAHLFSIRPIVEYYPIDHTESRDGAVWELFHVGNGGRKYESELRESLLQKNGIYVFYDSQGKALYVGQAKDQSLWVEMRNTFNRDRDTQKIRLVDHPQQRNARFMTAWNSPKNIKWSKLPLSDLSYYFSAYEVDRDLIDNVEALLIRAFSNDLLNSHVEKFQSAP